MDELLSNITPDNFLNLGVVPVLFVWLLKTTISNNKERESEYQKALKEHHVIQEDGNKVIIDQQKMNSEMRVILDNRLHQVESVLAKVYDFHNSRKVV